jgi:RHS repeat-associated protein
VLVMNRRILALCPVVFAFSILVWVVPPAAIASSGLGAWGLNIFGSLGTGSSTGPEECYENACSTIPVEIKGPTGVAAIAAAGFNGIALLSNGTAEAWGANYSGQLGDGTRTGPETCPRGPEPYYCSTKPVPVKGLTEGVAVATSGAEFNGHSAAVLSSGKVVDWGKNEYGDLGYTVGEEFMTEPITVAGISTATSVATLGASTCALLSGGTVDCWGDNELGTLGNGTTINSSAPVAVSGITNATALAAGGSTACVLLSGGKVDCWGENNYGQLGDGTSVGPETCGAFSEACSTTPIAVTGISSAVAISVAGADVCALLSGGGVDCWGRNVRGELGDGTFTGPESVCGEHHTWACSTSPVEVTGLTGATAIAVGGRNSCAIIAGGAVECWGRNSLGDLGDGSFTGPESCEEQACSTVPVSVGGLTGASGIASGEDFTVAMGASLHIERRRPEPEEEYGEYNEGAPNHKRACAGDPVSCAGGNLSESQTDIHLTGRGVPLQLTRTYNAQGAVAQTSPGVFGYGWTSTFGDHLNINSSAKTVSVVQANGSAVLFAGEPGVPGELSAPKWVQARLVLNSDGTYLYTLPSQETFHFDASGRLLSETDRNGNTTTMVRNPEGRLESVTDAVGRKLTLAYNAEGEIESATDPMGHTVKYAYEAGMLASVRLPGQPGVRWQFKYDSAHRLTAMTDGRNGITTNEYDSSSRVTSQTDPAERTTTFVYGSRVTTVTNTATGAVTKEFFTIQNEPESITKGFGTSSATTEAFKYDEAGDLTSTTDGNGHTTQYGYDSAGNRTSLIDADKHETKWTYNSTHDVETITTPKGETTTIKRDARGNAEWMARPAPGGMTQTTKYEYDTHGALIKVEDPLKRVWKFEYDSRGDRSAEIDPEGDKQSWMYNEDSQEISRVSPRGNVTGSEPGKYTTKTERDPQGRAIKITDPLGHETLFTYDGDGNIESDTDPNGHTTSYTYDADNERTKTRERNGTITEVGYDGAGEVTSQVDGSKHETKYLRNVIEQVTERIDPLGRKTMKQYDSAGNLKSVTDAAKRITTYTYDAANRLQEASYSESATHNVKYEYNADGERTSMTDGTGTTAYSYDQLGRMTEIKDGHGDVTKYEYDLANEQTRITYPNGKAVTQAFDKVGRLEKVTDWLERVTKFGYNPDSRLTTTTFPNGTNDVDKYVYDEAGRMSEVAITKGTETLATIAYSRDSDGQVKAVTSKGLPGEEKPAYEYDSNSRLIKGAGTTYEYDDAGDPTKTGTSTNTYDAANELSTGTGVAYSYNEVGERTKRTPASGAATTYAYDQVGNLITVTRPKEGKVGEIKDSYGYDGAALRASQAIGGTTTFLTWNGTLDVPVILNDGVNSYIYGPGGTPVEQVSNTGTTLYLHHDQQGSTRLLTGSAGKSEATITYDAYGNRTGITGTATTPLGYDAQYTSADTGLIYLRARTYDPATAQFLSVDPAAALTEAAYRYADDNPLAKADPIGLWASSNEEGGGTGFTACETAAERQQLHREQESETQWEEEAAAEENARVVREEHLRKLKDQVARENAAEESKETESEGDQRKHVIERCIGGVAVNGVESVMAKVAITPVGVIAACASGIYLPTLVSAIETVLE